MKLEIIRGVHLLENYYKLTITNEEMQSINLDPFDIRLLEGCDASEAISDKLQALEMIARRLEQKIVKPTEGGSR